MLNPISSPGDPLFYLHHTWLDKIWWDWQNLNISSRLFDMGGRNVQDPHEGFPEIPGVDPPLFPPGGIPPSVFPPGVFPPGVRPPRLRLGKRDGDPGNSTTLGHVLNMMNIVGNRTIGEVMDTRAEGGLCYEYVEPGLVVV
jgi:tyrosinase